MGVDALVDFAALDSEAAAVESTNVTPNTEVETTTEVVSTDAPVEGETGKDTETHNADGTEKTPEQVEEFKKTAAAKAESDKAIDTKTTPDSVRKA
jgi:hypothetical protein